MTPADLQTIQTGTAASDLTVLVKTCRDRYVRAADLLELRAEFVGRLRRLDGSEPVDVSPLLPAWRVLCTRYLEERFDPQVPLFGDHEEQETSAWVRFVHHSLVHWLAGDDAVARNVLRAVRAIPSKDPSAAVFAIPQHFCEMNINQQPLWASIEEIDQWPR
ncbi:MAG: hypothetical protein ACKVVP_15255 [Chloroflexota bacterium]